MVLLTGVTTFVFSASGTTFIKLMGQAVASGHACLGVALRVQ